MLNLLIPKCFRDFSNLVFFFHKKYVPLCERRLSKTNLFREDWYTILEG